MRTTHRAELMRAAQPRATTTTTTTGAELPADLGPALGPTRAVDAPSAAATTARRTGGGGAR